MKVGIISGRYPQTSFDSIINHKLYAQHHGYEYIHCAWPTIEKNRYLNKIHYLLSCFDQFEYLIWIDDDAFFWDFEKNIMDFAPEEDKFISLCKSPSFKSIKTFCSSGQFILKTTDNARKFLNLILSIEIKTVKNFWTKELGYFTNGDQDIMVYLFHTFKEYHHSYKLYDYKCFNSRVDNLKKEDQHNPLILHFTGKVEIKNNDYKWVQDQFQLHSSLVDQSILKQYNLIYNTGKKSVLNRLKSKIKKCLRF